MPRLHTQYLSRIIEYTVFRPVPKKMSRPCRTAGVAADVRSQRSAWCAASPLPDRGHPVLLPLLTLLRIARCPTPLSDVDLLSVAVLNPVSAAMMHVEQY
jgi:hypothetical protein